VNVPGVLSGLRGEVEHTEATAVEARPSFGEEGRQSAGVVVQDPDPGDSEGLSGDVSHTPVERGGGFAQEQSLADTEQELEGHRGEVEESRFRQADGAGEVGALHGVEGHALHGASSEEASPQFDPHQTVGSRDACAVDGNHTQPCTAGIVSARPLDANSEFTDSSTAESQHAQPGTADEDSTVFAAADSKHAVGTVCSEETAPVGESAEGCVTPSAGDDAAPEDEAVVTTCQGDGRTEGFKASEVEASRVGMSLVPPTQPSAGERLALATDGVPKGSV